MQRAKKIRPGQVPSLGPPRQLFNDLFPRQRGLGSQGEELRQKDDRRLWRILDSLSDGAWVLDLLTGKVQLGENWYRTLGYGKAGRPLDSSDWEERMHPDDRFRVRAMCNACVLGVIGRFEVDYRARNGVGAWQWLLMRGVTVTRNDDGRAVRMVGTHTDISRMKQAEVELQQLRFELEQRLDERRTELDEAHIALKVLLKERERDRKVLEGCVMANIDRLLEPFLTRLEESRLTGQQQVLVSVLRRNLEEVTIPFADKFSSNLSRLTPVEIQVANLVKMGKRTKEIARVLHLSAGTIGIHRKNIRKKLGMTHQKTNLQSILTTGM